MKIEKVDSKTLKITAPEGAKVGDNLTPQQLLTDLAKFVASPTPTKVEPRCAVCIAD
jgi:hypothetical protein